MDIWLNDKILNSQSQNVVITMFTMFTFISKFWRHFTSIVLLLVVCLWAQWRNLGVIHFLKVLLFVLSCSWGGMLYTNIGDIGFRRARSARTRTCYFCVWNNCAAGIRIRIRGFARDSLSLSYFVIPKKAKRSVLKTFGFSGITK